MKTMESSTLYARMHAALTPLLEHIGVGVHCCCSFVVGFTRA